MVVFISDGSLSDSKLQPVLLHSPNLIGPPWVLVPTAEGERRRVIRWNRLHAGSRLSSCDTGNFA
jgi:hypothetical protein